MHRFLSIPFVIFICFYAAGQTVQALEQTLSGKVNHVGAKDLPKNAKVQVELRDISLMDVASKLIGSFSTSEAKSFPIVYNIKYDPKLIVPGHRYAVSARITDADGKLLYITNVNNDADVGKGKSTSTDVAVISVAQPAPTVYQPAGVFKGCPAACRGKAKACAYGYQIKNGCEICKCNDPCNPPGKPVLCGPKQRCHVEKKADGTFGARCDSPQPAKGNDKKAPNSPKAECSEPKTIGMCRAALKRYHYNPATKACELFNYGGCGGNKNNFATKVECEKTCKA